MTTRLQIIFMGQVKDNDVTIGQKVKVKVIKHKINGGPGKLADFEISNERGIDIAKELLLAAQEDGEIVKSSTWYHFSSTGEKVQGEDKAKRIIEDKYMEEWLERYTTQKEIV